MRLMQKNQEVRALASALPPPSLRKADAAANAAAAAQLKPIMLERDRLRATHRTLLTDAVLHDGVFADLTSISATIEDLQSRIQNMEKARTGCSAAGRAAGETNGMCSSARSASKSTDQALQKVESWLSSQFNESLSLKTDAAVQAVRTTLSTLLADSFLQVRNSQSTSSGSQVCTTDLNRQLEEAAQCVRKESDWWSAASQDPLKPIPEYQLRTAAFRVAKAMAVDQKLLGELRDLIENEEEPTHKVKNLSIATKALRKSKASKQAALAKLALIDSSDEDEDEAAQARHDRSKAENDMRAADEAVSSAIVALAAVERHWPEVSVHVCVGLPPDLLPIWRPERDTNVFTTYCTSLFEGRKRGQAIQSCMLFNLGSRQQW
jgi:hypothetical protein